MDRLSVQGNMFLDELLLKDQDLHKRDYNGLKALKI
jgi:hypothetical protein